ncbi:hypothetical protein [Streptomyces hydrogenans]|uniref:hypothetical protein n=1 Tax=Streptomyces hydrogenans TaxID=1873719 RepID=UPI0035DF4070
MSEQPDLVDREGDRWRWEPAFQGYGTGDLTGWTREGIEAAYGPVREAGQEPDVRLLLAEALEDVARKLRESV